MRRCVLGPWDRLAAVMPRRLCRASHVFRRLSQSAACPAASHGDADLPHCCYPLYDACNRPMADPKWPTNPTSSKRACRAASPTAGRPRSPRRGAWSRRSAQVLRALRLRAGGDAGDRIHRRARQIPARPGPAERGRVLVPGRRRAVAVAALRPDRAARALCRGEFRHAARSPIARYRYGWVFRNEKPGPGRFRQFMQFDADTVGAPRHGRRRRDVHDGGGHDGSARHSARQLCGEGE